MKRRREESGFALLFVFMMAASVAIMLYMQLPRAAFEAQRGKEELLHDRGEQYIRGIQMYVVKWKSYPPNLDALEKTNNERFVRSRYKDPMTGKDEWRAIHVNAAGQLVDSLIEKQGEKKEAVAEFVSVLPSVGSTAGAGGEVGQNVGLRRRPSDNAPASGMNPAVDPQSLGNGAFVASPPTNPPTWNPQQSEQQQPPLDPNNPALQQDPEPQPGQVAGQPPQPMPGQPGMPPGYSGNFPQPTNQQQPMMPGAPPPQSYPPVGFPTPQGFPQGGFPTGVPGVPSRSPSQSNQPLQPGQPGQQVQPAQPGQPGQPGMQNAGLDMINRILTTPRASMNMGIPGANGLQVGGGIAGFASTYEAPSIKVYNDRQKYNEWEFVYDMKKDKRLLGAAAAGANQQSNMPTNPLGQPLGQNPGSTPGAAPTPNSNPSFGGPQTPAYPQPGRR